MINAKRQTNTFAAKCSWKLNTSCLYQFRHLTIVTFFHNKKEKGNCKYKQMSWVKGDNATPTKPQNL